MLGVNMVAGQVVAKPLSAQAQRALDDFAYFRRRYFGRESTPWQVRAANEVVRAIQSPEREYICMNEPPGTGKSTLFTCDIPTWLIVRDRTIRIMIGSRNRAPGTHVREPHQACPRARGPDADAESLLAGVAFDAEATIIADFGVFKPEAAPRSGAPTGSSSSRPTGCRWTTRRTPSRRGARTPASSAAASTSSCGTTSSTART